MMKKIRKNNYIEFPEKIDFRHGAKAWNLLKKYYGNQFSGMSKYILLNKYLNWLEKHNYNLDSVEISGNHYVITIYANKKDNNESIEIHKEFIIEIKK